MNNELSQRNFEERRNNFVLRLSSKLKPKQKEAPNPKPKTEYEEFCRFNHVGSHQKEKRNT